LFIKLTFPPKGYGISPVRKNNLLSLEGEDKGEGEVLSLSPPHPFASPCTNLVQGFAQGRLQPSPLRERELIEMSFIPLRGYSDMSFIKLLVVRGI